MSRVDDPVEKAGWIAEQVAAPTAAEIDRAARFPAETIEALRKERMLGVLVPRELGGAECPLSEVAAACRTLAQACASSGMVYAMHQIQVACLVRHARSAPFFQAYLAELADGGHLIASATTEAGVGGDVRTSLCAVEQRGRTFTLDKQASVISYGEHADDLLVTARRGPDAAASDQVLLLVRRSECSLERTTEWDTLGMRGTCSPGFRLRARGSTEQILPAPFADISSQTMLPVSHILWASVWLGIATDAIARAGAFVRAEARRRPGMTPPGALRLAEATGLLHTMRAAVDDAARAYEARTSDPDALSSVGFTVRMNNLKIAASQLVVQIVGQALSICGIAGYRVDSPYSVGRQLRDAYSAALMVSNDRILGVNATLLLVHRDV